MNELTSAFRSLSVNNTMAQSWDYIAVSCLPLHPAHDD